FLIPFIKNGYRVLGIDPAKNIVEMAEANGVPTKCCFFGTKTAQDLIKEKGKANIIFARNVLPHVANTRDFVDGLQMCLADNGTLAIEVHYAQKILEGLQYDSIYHEHLCYFTFKSLEKLLNDFNLHVFDIGKSPISGGSIIVYAKCGKAEESPVVRQYRSQEANGKINDFATWENFAQKSFIHRDNLLKILKQEKGIIAGYGASARSSTLLNFAKINSDIISVIADQNPLKKGRFTAGTHIPIVSPEEMIKKNPDTIVILAWNFADEISDTLRNKFNYKGRILIPLPNAPKII
ncbi:MAG: class I SAM-dependent methyltransferase, partial [Candidatus Staskawiczbacteria bacterium]